MAEQRTKFILDIRKKNQLPLFVEVITSISIGTDPRNDIVLSSPKIRVKHLLFEIKNNVLVLKHLALNNQTYLNANPLEENKSYIIDENDHLQMYEVEIIIKKEIDYNSPTPLDQIIEKKPFDFPSALDLTPEQETGKIKYFDNPTGSMKYEKRKNPSFFDKKTSPTSMTLWVVKIYSLIIDFFLTYFLMTIIIPSFGYDKKLQEVVTTLLDSFVNLNQYPFLRFLFVWYFLSLFFVTLFGTTIGQFVLGLYVQSKNTFSNLIKLRLKTMFCSLLLIPGQNDLSQKIFFVSMRKIGIVVTCLFFVFSPFFLPSPFNQEIIETKSTQKTLIQELKTNSIYLKSQKLQVELKSEIPHRYLLLPYPKTKDGNMLIGFEFIDLLEKRSLHMTQTGSINYFDLEKEISFANPLMNIHTKSHFENWTIEKKKERFIEILKTAPDQFINLVSHFGLLFGQVVIVKKNLLQTLNLTNSQDLLIYKYKPLMPVLSLTNHERWVFFIFTNDRIHFFNIESSDNNQMLKNAFEEYILSKFLAYNHDSNENSQNNILEAFDSLLESDEKDFLTYYTNLANSDSIRKVSFKENDLTLETFKFLRENVSRLETLLKKDESKKTIQLLDKQLTPMEIPGDIR
jgi:pSer/pThr/pTyr-binding forkhead associated (FHA) protein